MHVVEKMLKMECHGAITAYLRIPSSQKLMYFIDGEKTF